jgi:putative transposase
VAAQPLPKYLSTDHDPVYRVHRWLANLRVLDIEEIKSVPYAPISHPFVERQIGTIQREVLDQLFFWNALELTRKLEMFRRYSNARRVHRSLCGSTPTQRVGALAPAPAAIDYYGWRQYCHGLFQIPVAA